MPEVQRQKGGLLGMVGNLARAIGALLFGKAPPPATGAERLRNLHDERYKVLLKDTADPKLIDLAKKLAEETKKAGGSGAISLNSVRLRAKIVAQFPSQSRVAGELGVEKLPESLRPTLRELFYTPTEPTAEKLAMRPFPTVGGRSGKLASPLAPHEQSWGSRKATE